VRFSLSKISKGFLLAGFFVPLAFEAVFYLEIMPLDRIPAWLLVALWPTFGFVMAPGSDILGFIMSAIANALVYLLVGGLVSFSHRRLSQPPAKTSG